MQYATVLWAATSDLPSGWPLSSHTHSFYHLFYVRSGKTSFLLNHQEYPIGAGTCLLIPPDTLHGIPAESHTLLDVLEIKFSLPDTFPKENIRKCGTILPDPNRHLEYMIRRIVYQWVTKDSTSQEIADNLLTSFLLSLQPEESFPDASVSSYVDVSSYTELTKRVISYLEKNHSDPIHLDALAEEIGCNKRYLCTAFKQNTGCTIVSYLNHIRIRHATFCFFYYNVPISVIAQHVGFVTIVHFNRVFKELVGVSPGVYRRCFSLSDTSEEHRLTNPSLSLYEETLGSRILPLKQSMDALLLLGEYAKTHG